MSAVCARLVFGALHPLKSLRIRATRITNVNPEDHNTNLKQCDPNLMLPKNGLLNVKNIPNFAGGLRS